MIKKVLCDFKRSVNLNFQNKITYKTTCLEFKAVLLFSMNVLLLGKKIWLHLIKIEKN